ncbi:MAG TPA: peptidylprolyl isomerase [Steroidobacteraceae bacterium]|nr:peptidylprolyl isomerase [Steroidobacteraceae bacterium]
MNRIRRFLREPLVHFLLLGAALFGLYRYYGPTTDAGPSSKQIRFTLDDLGQMIAVFRSQWQREPTPQELSLLVEEKVQQEILYREAIAMGLDQDDEIVKRRMAQKMQFLAEDVATSREPTTDELQAWFAKNSQRFAMPPRISFRHLYFSPDRRGTRARDDAARALEQLAGKPEDAPLASTLADPFMFQDYYRDRAPDYLGKEFGPQFAQAVEKLPAGSWQGPVESGFGWHLVYVDTVIPGRVPDFEEVEPDVKTAWLAERKAEAWAKAYKDMREKYTVLLPVPAAVAADIPVPQRPAAAPQPTAD